MASGYRQRAVLLLSFRWNCLWTRLFLGRRPSDNYEFHCAMNGALRRRPEDGDEREKMSQGRCFAGGTSLSLPCIRIVMMLRKMQLLSSDDLSMTKVIAFSATSLRCGCMAKRAM